MSDKNYNPDFDEELEDEEEERSNKKGIRILLIILAVILILFGAIYTANYLWSQYEAKQQDTSYSEYVSPENEDVTDPKTGKVKNPIKFKKLQKQNDEIYAWIKVPGTKVDYPIVQSAADDRFYLKHSALDRSWLSSGAVYTEGCNTKSFKDRVTLIYGHNGYSDTMFTTLHYFEDEEFFDSHDKFYIYTPDSKLTYRIVSAFKYDNRHIMNSFDFLDNQVFRDFEAMILNPESTNKNVRKNLDKELTINDNIVVLSTCITNQKSNRYLVCGVLISNEETY